MDIARTETRAKEEIDANESEEVCSLLGKKCVDGMLLYVDTVVIHIEVSVDSRERS